MFKLLDNRNFVYQWDTDIVVRIDDPRVKEAHFCNRTSDCSLVVEVKDGLASVPNIILQQNYDIKVFAFDGKATLFEQTIKVVSRTMPADYVYEETEIIRYEDISKRMNALEESLESTVVEEVTKYIEENPIDVDLTGYATEDFVNEAISNSQDAYYLTFLETPVGSENAIEATAEMVEFAEHYSTNKNICLFIRDGKNNSISAYVPAIIAGLKTNIILTEGSIDATKILNNDYTRYYKYYIRKIDDKWMQYKESLGRFTLTTKEYVDEALANIDIPEAEVDLTNYYTKTEVDNLINNAPSGGLTEEEVQELIDASINSLGIAEEGEY